MEDLHSILSKHHKKHKDSLEKVKVDEHRQKNRPNYSEIPDLFFDEILLRFKLSRVEIIVLMFIYRSVWCKANLYKVYGISQVMSLKEIASALKVDMEQLHQALRKIEELKLIETIRPGQYFIRRYFIEEFDLVYQQTYNDF